MLEKWQDGGTAFSTSLTDAQLMALASSIKTEAYGQELHNLVDQHESRFVASEGNSLTAEYIKAQFKHMGMNVTEQHVLDERINKHIPSSLVSISRPTRHTNVLGMLKGTDLAHEVVVLGAHFDSVNWEDTSASAPGVDDNGSGVGLMLAVARVLSAVTPRPRRSLLFAAFNAEEEGCVGSDHFAELFTPGGSGPQEYGQLKAVFIADEVAWPGQGQDRREAIFETSGRGQETTSMVDTLAHYASLKNASSSVGGDGIGDGTQNFLVNYNGFGSDHMSFLDRGIPSVLIIERDNLNHANVYGHSARDTFEHVDLSFGASMSRLVLRAVAAFASPSA